jgi:ribonucleoside-diphosphate reductase alpha chain
MLIQKKNGKFEEFDIQKIKTSILLAFDAAGIHVDVMPVVHNVLRAASQVRTTREIQTIIENTLMTSGHVDVARKYIIYSHNTERHADPDAVADYVHVAKYARTVDGRKETYPETVARVEKMHTDRWPQYKGVIREAFDLVREKRVLPSMRTMQYAGTGNDARYYNCSYTVVDRPRVFSEIFYLLLCGCGVGFSVQWVHVRMLPPMMKGSRVRHHKVKDSIEGWAEAVDALVMAATRGEYVEFDYSAIRPEGSVIKSGGKAPGHLPLKEALERIRGILSVNRKLKPIECHDIICFLAQSVLSGGVRRSSLISIFSVDDTEMMYAKDPSVFDYHGKNTQRALANNSVALRRDGSREVFDRVLQISNEGYGEPGFVFLDDPWHGTNPCAEIGLDARYGETSGFGFCNLTEINMAKCGDVSEYIKACEAAALIGTMQACYTDFKYGIDPRICQRDALLGVSMTGIMDNRGLRESYTAGARRVVEINQKWARLFGTAEAARCTTVKPSGTASLLLGCVGSGVHPHHAKRYFRRITANKHEAAARKFAEMNPHMVDVKPNGDLSLVFCVEAPDGEYVKTLKAAKMLEIVFEVYDNWVKPGTVRGTLTHNVSATVTLHPGDDVANLIWDNRFKIAALSFAPLLLDETIPFIPRQEATPAKWDYYLKGYRKVNYAGVRDDDVYGSACEGQSCSI